MVPLLLATNNPGKAKELRALVSELAGIVPLTPAEFGLALQVKETGSSYSENARLKAMEFAQASGLICLADDSGLEVHLLDGAPGLYSARFSPKEEASDADRRRFLLDHLEKQPRPWTARFRSTVCLARPEEDLACAEGQCRGEIIPEARGLNGFGYDPIFLVEGIGRTMAELSLIDKNRLSHRAQAIRQLMPILKTIRD